MCAYTFSGAMYYWGKDVDFPDMTRSKPTTFPNFTKKVLEVASGKDHCLILSTDGEVWKMQRLYSKINIWLSRKRGFTLPI